MQNVSEAKFTGVIAFKNPQAAYQMQLLVNTIIDKSVNIFSSKRTFAPSTLVDDIQRLIELSDNFVDYASNEENAKIERTLINEMDNNLKRLKTTINQFNGTRWSLSQSQAIAESMGEIFKKLEGLTEKNEEDHVRKALKQTLTAKQCQASLANGTDYDPSGWSVLMKNYQTMQQILFGMMENRASVTKEENRKQDILELKKRMTIISDSLPRLCEEARISNYPQELMNKIQLAQTRLTQYTEQFEEILKFGIECFSSFKHTPIEPEKFGEQIDDLINAIHSGDQSGFLNKAKVLTSEVGNIKNRELLENETAKLNEQTKQLLINAREVLKDNDRENAKKKMNEIAAVLKKNVQDLALQEKQMMNTKKKLSKQATGLGLAMQNMGIVLNNITGNEVIGSSPIFKTKSESDFNDIERSLDDLEQSKGLNNTRRRSSSSSSSSDELDDLEKELNELETTPIKSNTVTNNNVSFRFSTNKNPPPQHQSTHIDELDDLERELNEIDNTPTKNNNDYSIQQRVSVTFVEPKTPSTFTSQNENDLDELEMLERELEDL